MRFFHKGSGGDVIIASHHPKWSLTWSWILTWSRHLPPYNRFRWYAHRTYRYRKGVYGFIEFWRFRFERQPTMRLHGDMS